jgi:hypothetical protein
MRRLIFILLFFSLGAEAQFLKYSTFYISTDIHSPLAEQNHYRIDRQTGELTDETILNPYNYKFNFGIRKIARFDYENKAKAFYDGSENSISNTATIGAVKGFEYNANLSLLRDRGKEFVNQEYWLRYVSEFWLVRLDFQDKQEIKLKHFGGEARAKLSVGKFDFTIGAKHRSHPVYGYNPFEENFDAEEAWWQIAYDLGYVDEYYYIDGDQNGVDDWYDYYNWQWFAPDGTLIAQTDQEFYKYHFGTAVDMYNTNELKKLGLQQELSAVIGLAFYHYTDKFWIHSWADIMPFHNGLTDYSYANLEIEDKTNLDFDFGMILGTKITDRLGLFIEGKYQRYWDIDNYEFKTGINYLFL